MMREPRVQKTNRPCAFCEQKIEPEYKDSKTLSRYLTEKGKIVSRTRSGICHKHQSHLATAIKRARNLALLPFVTVVE